MIRHSGTRRLILVLVVLATLLIQVVLPDTWLRRLRLSALAAASLTFEPASVSLGVGAETWVTVRINDVADLYGADVRLAFDPAVIEVVDALPGGSIEVDPGDMPVPDFVVKNEADNVAGSIWYVVSQVGTPPSSGSGTLARIKIRGVSDGATSLSFSSHLLSSPVGGEIAHSVGSCAIEVGAGAPSTPTSTATEGPSPTVTSTSDETATPSPTVTETPTSTETPTVTETPLPSGTVSPSATPTTTMTMTPALISFSGYVYSGGFGDTTTPLPGVQVQLLGSWVTGTPGEYVSHSVTDAQGRFEVSYLGSYPNYSLVEIDLPNYESRGAQPGAGGTVPDTSGNWVEFRSASAGSYPGTLYFDYPLTDDTRTPTSSEPTTEASPTPTSGTPTATEPPPGVPVYVGRRSDKDTFLDAREPTRNYGREGFLHIGLDASGPIKTALLWFDLSEIPMGAAVTEGQLFLFGSDLDTAVPACVSGMNRDWGEYQATWLQALTDDLWIQEGALDVEQDQDGECIPGMVTDGGQAQFYEWNVAPLLRQWFGAGRPNQGFVVQVMTDSKARERQGLYSREIGAFALRPFLSLVYVMPTWTPTPTVTLTPAMTPTLVPTIPGKRIYLPVVMKNAS